MQNIVNREYLKEHSGEVLRSFGLMAYVRALRSQEQGLLEQMEQKYLSEGIPMPGPVGNAYRLSTLFELRAARIYGAMLRRFDSAPEVVKDFFRTLQVEEEEHARIMTLCLYTIDSQAEVDFVPSVRDPEICALLRELRKIERGAWRLSLDRALELTEQLEEGEINNIFGRLLKQAQNPRNEFIIAQLAKVEGHASAVPKRLKALRETLQQMA